MKSSECVWPLGREPWVGQTLSCCGPPLRHQVQHGQQKAAETVRLLFGPLVLFYQDVEQTPRLQLGDVTQVAWEKHVWNIQLELNHKERNSEACRFWTEQMAAPELPWGSPGIATAHQTQEQNSKWMWNSWWQMGVFTFLGEKLLGVFACHDQLPRNFSQQLNDKRYVILKNKHNQNRFIENIRAFMWGVGNTSINNKGQKGRITLKFPLFIHLIF